MKTTPLLLQMFKKINQVGFFGGREKEGVVYPPKNFSYPIMDIISHVRSLKKKWIFSSGNFFFPKDKHNNKSSTELKPRTKGLSGLIPASLLPPGHPGSFRREGSGLQAPFPSRAIKEPPFSAQHSQRADTPPSNSAGRGGS